MKKFSLKLKTVDVEIESAGGETKIYQIRELNGRDRDKFMRVLTSMLDFAPDGTAKPKRADGLELELVSLSLFLNGAVVPREELEEWPATVIEALAEVASEISDVNTKKKTEAGND